MRVWLVGILAALSACNDQGLAPAPAPIAVPTSSSSSSGSVKDGGSGGDDDDDAMTMPDPTAWGDPKTTRRAGMLRIEQLNVRRFFDATCDSTACGGTNYEDVATPEAFDKRAAQIANDLATIQADVITLAEVENQGCLDLVQKKLQAAGFSYPVAYVAETGGTGSVDVAVLARGKLDSVVNYKQSHPLTEADGTKTYFTRELPEVHLTLGKNKVIVFAAHFRSKSSDDPAKRLAEAKGAHDIIVATGAANADQLVLLGGDLNDSPGSPPIDALEGDGKLIRVASDLDPAKQGTYKFGGGDQAIDHIFTTKNHASSYVAMSATVVRDAGEKGFAGSDHATLYADFTLP